jgi:acyl transferase domain-containing protein
MDEARNGRWPSLPRLDDYGYPDRSLDLERTATIFGTAMGGEMHYLTTLRISFPEIAKALESVAPFSGLPVETRRAILSNWESAIGELYPPVTEDSMPGELANIISGRVANVFNLRGPNFVTDAACAASFAAVEAAVSLLVDGKADAVLTGGVDHNMGASSFVQFSKIGALSAAGSRPFGRGADGFVMGEGAAAFLLKRLADAERDGDRIYAVIRGIGGASDGKGKGIYAPNPIGQQLAMLRAWQAAGLDPASATLVEAHGTSTRVGDVVEVESLAKVFCGASQRSIALGSVKSNIGHLKSGAGAAGLLKTVLALHHKILPPTLNADPPNPDIDFRQTPFNLVLEAREWRPNGSPASRSQRLWVRWNELPRSIRGVFAWVAITVRAFLPGDFDQRRWAECAGGLIPGARAGACSRYKTPSTRHAGPGSRIRTRAKAPA